jgi:cytochrome c oxidase subunit 3
MPAIVTPPKTKPNRRPDPREPNDGDHGAGRRPPTDKRTGGGGEGDNWSDQPVGRRDMMFFIAIISSFIVTKSGGHIDAYGRYINEWLPTVIPSILWLNTAVLIISSATAEVARRSMFREDEVMDEWFGLGRPTSRRAALWLAVTLALGTLFLAGQWVAWQQLAAQHVRFSSSGHFFFLITVAHALHLFLGLAGLIAALAALRASRQFATRQILVDATVWYWHAMGALWLVLFFLLERFQ